MINTGFAGRASGGGYAGGSGTFSSGDVTEKIYGRVLDVIISPDHPKYKYYGGSQALYGVVYQRLFAGESDDLKVRVNEFAYCKSSTFRRIPIKNEIVSLEYEASAEWTEDLGVSHDIRKLYWTNIVSLWNNPNLNAYPDTLKYSGAVDTGPDFKENGKIKPLQLAPGDLAIEGRYGNSIRFGGTQASNIEIATTDSNGSPYTIIRNGQGSSSGDVTSESIDKDDSSVWLTSNHKVNLTEAGTKRSAWNDKYKPGKFKDYQGKQIVMNSDRLVLNAREEDIQVAAKRAVGVVATVVGIDGREYVAFDATKIYLGTAAFQEKEPVLKGKTSTNWMGTCLDYMDKLLEVLSAPTGTNPWEAGVIAAATALRTAFNLQKQQLPLLHSLKVFTE